MEKLIQQRKHILSDLISLKKRFKAWVGKLEQVSTNFRDLHPKHSQDGMKPSPEAHGVSDFQESNLQTPMCQVRI